MAGGDYMNNDVELRVIITLLGVKKVQVVTSKHNRDYGMPLGK